jgi:hypothetical protein
MGVDVSAKLFVGILEDDLPEGAREKLEARAELWDGYEVDEDTELSEWLECVKEIPGLSFELELTNDNAYSGGTATVFGFNITSTECIEDALEMEAVIQDLQKAAQEFEELFGVKPKVFVFPRWW